MANDQRIENLQALKTAVGEWADTETERLEDETVFLRSIQTTEKRVSSQTAGTATELAFNDVNDFLRT